MNRSDDRLRRLVLEGRSDAEIADLFDWLPWRVIEARKRLGLKKDRKGNLLSTLPIKEPTRAGIVRQKGVVRAPRAVPMPSIRRSGMDFSGEELTKLAGDPPVVKAFLIQLAMLAPDPTPFVLAARALMGVNVERS